MVKGRFPYRRAVEFLSQGRLYFKDSVKCVSLAYDTVGRSSAGLRRFVGEYVPQIVFKNPRVSLFSFKNEGHTPHIKVYLADGSKLMVHCEDKRSEVILEELSSVSGKPDSQVQREQAKEEPNMANFGDRSKGQFCICEVPGQTPCPKLTPISNVHHKWHEQATAS